MKTLIPTLFFALVTVFATAQTSFELPKNITLKADADYAKYETDIVNAAKWLEETDLNKEAAKRKQVNAFVIQWATGSPTVSVEINEQLGKIYGKNTELLMIYIANFCRNFIENKGTATKTTATKAALISIMSVYKKDIEITKSKEMEKLIKANEENKLDDYITKHFK